MMRGKTVKIVLCLLAAVMAWPAASPAAGRVGRKKPTVSRPAADKANKLEDIMKSPREYLERRVFFYCRYATTANLFKNVSTSFNASEHVNFAVWPDKTVLWDSEARKNALPTLYVAKSDEKSLEALRTVRKYELIAVTGYVLNAYAKYPWILVTGIEKVETEQDVISDNVIEHMQAGYEALSKNFGGVAARHFEQAVQFGLPAEYAPTAYRHMACAYHIDNQFDKARDYLRLAIECDPADPLLHLALADITLAMGDGDEALAHCVFAMERSGRYPQTYGIMGEAKSLSGDYVKAFLDLNAAANTPGITSRESAMVKVRRARIYNRAGRHADAAQVYDAVSKAGEPLGGEPWLHNEVGLFYESRYLKSGEAGYLDGAAEAYAEAARLSRYNDAAILYNQAESEFRRLRLSGGSDYAKARELITEINRIEPEYAPARILEGRVLFAEGKANEAEERYQTIVNFIRDDALALMSLAEAYLELDRRDAAVDAMRRARSLQPWNHRIKAVGEFIGDEVPGASPEAVLTPDEPLRTVEDAGPVQARPAVHDAPATPSPSPNAGGATAEPDADPVQTPPAAYYAPPTPYPPQTETVPQIEYITPEYEEPVGNPVPEYRNVPSGGGETYRIDGGLMTVRSVEGMRSGSESRSWAESAAPRPQEIQTSVMPAPTGGRLVPPYPVAKVNMDGVYPRRPSAVNEIMRGEGASGSGHVAVPERSDVEENAVPEFEYGDSLFGDAGNDTIVSSETALASLSVRRRGERGGKDGNLPPFSFEPDGSPAIIPDFQAPVRIGTAMPARNASLYRRIDGSRQPAEIIEKEPAASSVPSDASAMTPSGDGTIHRTEVNLPSSAIGIGMSSDYPGNVPEN